MSSGSGDAFWSGDPAIAATTDVELLKSAWRNEKVAPEILQFETSLVQRAREQIKLLEETVEEFTGTGTDDLMVSLYQMDLDRTLFLLRSYLRTRLQKIERYMIHISKTTELWNRLSEEEQKFTTRCTDIMEKHLEQSLLSGLPYGYQSILKQSISSEEDDMDEWWMNFGIDDLEFQNLAIRILSQTCSSSGCERNWSVFERIHTKRRNRLEHKRLNDLVYTHYNLRLKERQLSRKSLIDPISLENIDLTDEWVVEAEAEDAPLLDVDEVEDWMDVADAILDEGEGADAVVPEPQLETFVFCKSKGFIESIQLDDLGDEVTNMVADDLYILRYKSIKALVESGRIDLV